MGEYTDKTFVTRSAEIEQTSSGRQDESASLYQGQDVYYTVSAGEAGSRHYASESVDDPAPRSGRSDGGSSNPAGQ